ncbi:MAG: hypothetical protein J0M30_03550 [Chitinophagales bacterium]|nr:hypothetical protein [Chitinophagales bacterium]
MYISLSFLSLLSCGHPGGRNSIPCTSAIPVREPYISMRQKILIFLLIFSPHGVSLSAQSITKKYPEVAEKVKKINADSSFKKITLTNEQFMPQMTDGGGELTGYFKKGIIQKITRKIGLSYGIETYDYYFTNEKLMFIYETFYVFIVNDSLGTLDQTKTELNFIGTYYFQNNKLIDSETVGHNRFEKDEIDMETILLKETEENLSMLKQKRAKAAKEDLVPGCR